MDIATRTLTVKQVELSICTAPTLMDHIIANLIAQAFQVPHAVVDT